MYYAPYIEIYKHIFYIITYDVYREKSTFDMLTHVDTFNSRQFPSVISPPACSQLFSFLRIQEAWNASQHLALSNDPLTNTIVLPSVAKNKSTYVKIHKLLSKLGHTRTHQEKKLLCSLGLVSTHGPSWGLQTLLNLEDFENYGS
jgi:hypothetical protein